MGAGGQLFLLGVDVKEAVPVLGGHRDVFEALHGGQVRGVLVQQFAVENPSGIQVPEAQVVDARGAALQHPPELGVGGRLHGGGIEGHQVLPGVQALGQLFQTGGQADLPSLELKQPGQGQELPGGIPQGGIQGNQLLQQRLRGAVPILEAQLQHGGQAILDTLKLVDCRQGGGHPQPQPGEGQQLLHEGHRATVGRVQIQGPLEEVHGVAWGLSQAIGQAGQIAGQIHPTGLPRAQGLKLRGQQFVQLAASARSRQDGAQLHIDAGIRGVLVQQLPVDGHGCLPVAHPVQQHLGSPEAKLLAAPGTLGQGQLAVQDLYQVGVGLEGIKQPLQGVQNALVGGGQFQGVTVTPHGLLGLPQIARHDLGHADEGAHLHRVIPRVIQGLLQHGDIGVPVAREVRKPFQLLPNGPAAHVQLEGLDVGKEGLFPLAQAFFQDARLVQQQLQPFHKVQLGGGQDRVLHIRQQDPVLQGAVHRDQPAAGLLVAGLKLQDLLQGAGQLLLLGAAELVGHDQQDANLPVRGFLFPGQGLQGPQVFLGVAIVGEVPLEGRQVPVFHIELAQLYFGAGVLRVQAQQFLPGLRRLDLVPQPQPQGEGLLLQHRSLARLVGLALLLQGQDLHQLGVVLGLLVEPLEGRRRFQVVGLFRQHPGPQLDAGFGAGDALRRRGRQLLEAGQPALNGGLGVHLQQGDLDVAGPVAALVVDVLELLDGVPVPGAQLQNGLVALHGFGHVGEAIHQDDRGPPVQLQQLLRVRLRLRHGLQGLDQIGPTATLLIEGRQGLLSAAVRGINLEHGLVHRDDLALGVHLVPVDGDQAAQEGQLFLALGIRQAVHAALDELRQGVPFAGLLQDIHQLVFGLGVVRAVLGHGLPIGGGALHVFVAVGQAGQIQAHAGGGIGQTLALIAALDELLQLAPVVLLHIEVLVERGQLFHEGGVGGEFAEVHLRHIFVVQVVLEHHAHRELHKGGLVRALGPGPKVGDAQQVFKLSGIVQDLSQSQHPITDLLAGCCIQQGVKLRLKSPGVGRVLGDSSNKVLDSHGLPPKKIGRARLSAQQNFGAKIST